MLEEEVLDTHKIMIENTTGFLNDARTVFSATHEVDYDQEGKALRTFSSSYPIQSRTGYVHVYSLFLYFRFRRFEFQTVSSGTQELFLDETSVSSIYRSEPRGLPRERVSSFQ